MASNPELSPARLAESARCPRVPRDLPARLRLFAALLREMPAASPGPCLLWREEGGRVCAVAVDRRLVLGRTPECDIVLRSARVSRRHCAVAIMDGDGAIEDLQSANGTFVNGARVVRDSLHDGDVIELGGTPIIFVAVEA
jgi:hypothetical protein